MTVLPAVRSRLRVPFRLSLGAFLTLLGTGQAQAQSISILSLLPTDGRSVSIGQEVTGALSSSDPRGPDDAPLEAWLLEGSPGQAVTVDLRSSDFDAYLYVVGPGFDETLWDDDSAGGCDARVAFTVLEDGPFTVVASSQSGQTGPYSLSVTTDPEPAAPYSCGSVNPATLLELPTEGRVLELRGSVRGAFNGSEPTIQDGRPAAAWTIEGRAGESVSIRLLSDDFDSYLHVFGPGMTEALSDDDSAGDLDSQITLVFPESGTYRVIASALSANSRGSYQIETVEPVDLSTLPTEDRMAVAGETVSGFLPNDGPVLTQGRHGQAWALRGFAGQSLSIDLVSDDFDTYLYLVGPGIDTPLEDDDGGNDTNSRLTTTLPESGTYRVIVSAYSSGSGGAFDLQVSGVSRR